MAYRAPCAHHRVMKALPVFFSPLMVAPSQSYSPSAEKPAAVLASWQRLGVPLELFPPVPVTQAELCLAHDEELVSGVLSLQRDNGFGNRSAAVAEALPYTSGALLCAAREALRNGAVAVAPCSGFHHAGWRSPAGFCTFNGLMVSAAVLHAEGVRRIGIVDFDHHYGNGTDDIIDHLGARAWVHHFSAGKQYDHPRQASEFFRDLSAILEAFADCDVVLYQAGADPHIADPLGGWLTTEQLRQRDARVFQFFHAARIALAWDLAGGYQRDAEGCISPVLEIHDNTLLECARVYLS
jgi:acetoin utilization deacetylase AcuC-like enzyme